jgi:hypothetical protein
MKSGMALGAVCMLAMWLAGTEAEHAERREEGEGRDSRASEERPHAVK